MKSMNVKRIAALAAGTALLSMSLVAADVTFQNQQVINQNGQPVVKVVVGANAQASDGVAAANIAATIGNMAFKSQTITATVQGQATCAVDAAASGAAGTCAISNEKVTLEVTLPGVVSGAYKFSTLINDYADKFVADRQTVGDAGASVANNYSTNNEIKPTLSLTPPAETARTTGVDADQTGNPPGLKIQGSDFSPLQSSTLRDPQAGNSYTEEQRVWVGAATQYDDVLRQVVSKSGGRVPTTTLAYVVDFTHDSYGVPVSTCTSYNSTTICSENDLTDRHRVPVKFLGEDWIISQLTPPGGLTATGNSQPGTVTINFTNNELGKRSQGTARGTVGLAKESAYGVIKVGENLSAGAYSVKLVDITLGNTAADQRASFEIYDANGVKVKEDQQAPGGTYTFNAPDGSKVRVRVYKTNPGYTLAAKWAELAIYSQEVTLSDNSQIDNAENRYWKSYIYWSNNPNNNNVPTLKTIIIQNEDPTSSTLKLQKGGTINLIGKPAIMQLQFDGTDLADPADYDGITYTLTQTTLSFLNTTSQCQTGNQSTFLLVSSGKTDAFSGSLLPGTVQQFFIDMQIRASGAGVGAAVEVYALQSGQSCYTRNQLALAVLNTTNATFNYQPGDGNNEVITWRPSIGAGNTTLNQNSNIQLREITMTLTQTGFAAVDLYVNNESGSFAFSNSSTTNKGLYRPTTSTATGSGMGPAYTGVSAAQSVDPGYVTERGSVFNGQSTTSAQIKGAKKVANAVYFLKTAGSSPSAPVQVTLGEGESSSLGSGVTVKVKTITETVGACTAAGGSAACSVDQSGVSALLSTGKASEQVVTRFPVEANLVVLDSDAGGVANVISVGGPAVNTITKQAVTGSALDPDKDASAWADGKVYAQKIGNTIVVAGGSASDTMEAAKRFIAGLQQQ
ncbi:S-layer protein [Candidatus Micrarchaeota archaeon]|nr:S-layer protein [Candidatus Micrarchaeota archaeon]